MDWALLRVNLRDLHRSPLLRPGQKESGARLAQLAEAVQDRFLPQCAQTAASSRRLSDVPCLARGTSARGTGPSSGGSRGRGLGKAARLVVSEARGLPPYVTAAGPASPH